MYEYKAKLIKVVDGDTVDLEIDCGFKIFFRERFRLLGINTPETYGVKRTSEEYLAGLKASVWLEETLLKAKEIIVETTKDKKGKYGRYLALLHVDGVTINVQMVELGLAEQVDYD